MTRTAESPSVEYPGSITLPDHLTFPQLLDFEEALTATRGKADARSCAASIEAVNAIVTWNIENLPDKPEPKDIFEGRPYREAGKFYRWVINECSRVMLAEKEIPNG